MSRLSSWHRQVRVVDSTIRRLGGASWSPSLSSSLSLSSTASLSNSQTTRPCLRGSHPHRLLQQRPTRFEQQFLFYPVSSRFFSSDHQATLNNLTIKPWSTSMIESNGDYRDESFLEDFIGGPLYENQHKLPNLPVPTIDETLKRFLPTALPLARTKEEEMALMDACKAFPEQAKVLQERLVARRNGEMKDSSWLQLWWNQLGYLQVRDPVVVNVSYFFQFTDDPTIDTTGPHAVNIQRGAAMLFATAEFRKLVCSGGLPAEKVGKQQTPLCSTPYKYMFNACRIPQRGQDSYRIYDPSRYTHCIVARKGHFFSMELVDANGDPLPVSVLEQQLEQCVSLAEAQPSFRAKLGILTSNDRDDWADAREELVKSGGIAMEEALQHLESGAIVLNLDDEAPVSRKECGELFWTGGVTSGENRWFDKSIQIMVANNGKAGLIAEHSMMDGMGVVNFSDYVTKTTCKEAKKRSGTGSGSIGGSVYEIFSDGLDAMDENKAEALEAKARDAFNALITSQENQVQSFQGYGSSFMKQSGFAPDAFVQMAMQLATYRLFGEQAGTYEATQVRPFLHGRTETTRTVSTASAAFIKKMGLFPKWDETDSATRKEKLALLQEATTVHSDYTKTAAQAQGVDRHFLGLSLLLEGAEKKPALYSDPVFIRSKTWRVSTSHLTHPRHASWGFGEVVPDGVGIAYAILPESCVFHVTARRGHGWSDKLSELFEESLLEIKRVIEMDKVSTSKL